MRSTGWGGRIRRSPADAIAVFGAAEYGGRPSPVYHARLDHAVALYERGIAPLIITFGGGSDKDSGKTEGGVGRDYLLAKGGAVRPDRGGDALGGYGGAGGAAGGDCAGAGAAGHVVVVSDNDAPVPDPGAVPG